MGIAEVQQIEQANGRAAATLTAQVEALQVGRVRQAGRLLQHGG
jgi:hypothetical protein